MSVMEWNKHKGIKERCGNGSLIERVDHSTLKWLENTERKNDEERLLIKYIQNGKEWGQREW